jgi:hypothetical protein
MTILLLGAGPRLAWVRSVLQTLYASARPESEPEAKFIVVDGPPTREGLVSLADGPIDALILVDHAAFAGHAAPEAAALAEAVRGEAQRAVFALELARRAARTLSLSGDAGDWLNVLATLVAAPLPAEPPDPCPLLPSRPDTPVATLLLHAYLEPLFAAAGQIPIGPATSLALAWSREAFLDGDAPGETLPATVEVAGRARILAYGPYLPLPAGAWQATAFLGFSPDIGRLPFILEADTGGSVARGFFEVERGGIFTLELDFQVTDALHPVELRLISQDSALEGQLALIEVELKQLPA